MSLKGKVYCEDPEAIGGFEAFVAKLKQSIGEATGTNIGTDTKNPFGNLYLEGIVQGDIKLQAVNDWKTTSFYGFTDALKGVNIGGGTTTGVSAGVKAEASAKTSLNGAAMLKFANTVMNVLGYTLGGTGPASKKMYGGSNLNGFAVQFKWYTPHMSGWFEAIQALCYLGWPTSVWNSNDNPQVSTRQNDPTTAEKAATEAAYVEIVKMCGKHTAAIIKMSNDLKRAKTAADANNWQEASKIANQYSGNNGWTDLNQIYTTVVAEGLVKQDSDYFDTAVSKLTASSDLDFTVLTAAKSRSKMQLKSSSIGSDINSVHWYDNSTSSVPTDPSAASIDGGGTASTPAKETGAFDNLPGANLIKAGGTLLSAGSDLIKGLVDSFAKNPPKVCLEIYDYKGSLKYRFSPLIITSFGVTASRETIDGDPVIVTIDIGFDYYQVNATNAIQAPNQLFAGAPIFNNKQKV